MPQGGGSGGLHCQLWRAAAVDDIQREGVEVARQPLKQKDIVACHQCCVVHVKYQPDAVVHRLLSQEQVAPDARYNRTRELD